jgi:hypothetical protein
VATVLQFFLPVTNGFELRLYFKACNQVKTIDCSKWPKWPTA